MEKTPVDFMSIFLEIGITAIVLAILGSVAYYSTQMRNVYQTDVDKLNMVQKINTYSKYDGVRVSSSDVCEAALKYYIPSTFSVNARVSGVTQNIGNKTISEMYVFLGVDSTFNASLTYDPNDPDLVLGIFFDKV
jgi:hypothetical protein